MKKMNITVSRPKHNAAQIVFEKKSKLSSTKLEDNFRTSIKHVSAPNVKKLHIEMTAKNYNQRIGIAVAYACMLKFCFEEHYLQ